MAVPFVTTKWGNYTPQHLRVLKDEYEKAVADDAEEFEINGARHLTLFAKYLIEFLESQGLVAL